MTIQAHARRCLQCRFPLPPGMLKCINPKCRAWNVPTTAVNIDDSTVLLGSGVRSVKLPRYTTKLVDKVFGGGIVTTAVCLMGGEPGAGKTTLGLQLSDIICDITKRESLYIANEQSAEEIEDTASRLRLKHASPQSRLIRIVRAMGGVNHDIGTLLLHYKPCLVILDSLTKWVGEDLALAVQIAQALKDYAVKLQCPVIIVNQVTKDGDQAGRKQLEHAVDMTCMFDILEGEVDEEGNPIPKPLSPRRLMSEKNRFGPAPEELFFTMTETGLVPTEVQAL